ncbi:hypothetical protein SBBP2_750003 [Burkholderiales bacterium]|nr:hypothetical protein SBBP2_750003 [Burkholderiales bacterium]
MFHGKRTARFETYAARCNRYDGVGEGFMQIAAPWPKNPLRDTNRESCWHRQR